MADSRRSARTAIATASFLQPEWFALALGSDSIISGIDLNHNRRLVRTAFGAMRKCRRPRATSEDDHEAASGPVPARRVYEFDRVLVAAPLDELTAEADRQLIQGMGISAFIIGSAWRARS
jgi:hypothetical protein